MKTDLYNMKGVKDGEITLPKEVFGVEVNLDLVHQVMCSQMSNRRQNTAHSKNRSEIRGGGKKPWRQKGTGRARHGSRRSPIWIGGGATFGPRNERNYKKDINKKAKRKALFMALSGKKEKDFIFFISKLESKKGKTSEISSFLEKIKCDGSALIVLPEMDKNMILASRNIEKVDTIQARDLNLLDLLSYKYLIMPESSVGVVKENFLKDEK
jgi:large subunit ribosomal protein L4